MAEAGKGAAAEKGKKGAAGKPDLATLLGFAMALGGILGGLLIEGGKIKDILQFTAAMIVLGGTVGAVMIATPLPVLKGAAGRLMAVFFDASPSFADLIDSLVGYATKARKGGLVGLEEDAQGTPDPFLQKALMLVVDGTDLQELRTMLEIDIGLDEQHGEAEAKVFEAAGGFSPTIGIIGAVLGLIQVMKNLANIDEVGHGIAVSFVATVYGVGAANLLFLPAAAKIKAAIHQETQRKEIILEAVCGIIEGLNPKLIRSKLSGYAYIDQAKAKKAKGGEVAAKAGEKQAPVPAKA
jgi:chemotaxis protein MotA